MSYKINLLSNFYTKVLLLPLGFCTQVFVARALGPEGNGFVAYLLLIVLILGNYGHIGINNATTYFQKRSSYKPNEIFNVNASFLLVIWIVISIVLCFLKYNKIILNSYNLLIFGEGIILILFHFIQTLMRSFYIGQQRLREINKYLLINYTFIFIATFILFLLDKLTPLLYVSIKLGCLTIKLYLLKKNLGLKYSFTVNFHLILKELKFGLVVYFSALFIYLNYRADQLLIKHFEGLSQLGLYSLAVVLAELVFIIPQSVTSALTGKLYNIAEYSSEKKLITTLTIKYTFYCCVCIAVIGYLLKPIIPIIYGNEFADSVNVFIILLIGVIFASIGKVSHPYYFTKGKPGVHLFITFITFLINIILNLILIPRYGIQGAAYATAISYAIYAITYIMVLVRMENFKFINLLAFSSLDIKIFYSLIKRT